MCNKSTLDKILKEVSNAYKKVYGDKLVKVVLYGSYARGDYDEESDIDIVGIIKADRINVQRGLHHIRKVASDLGLEHDIYISPKAIPYEEFLKYKDYMAYYQNIIKEGVAISAW